MRHVADRCQSRLTTPGPCGGTGDGVVQRWISDMPAIPLIMLLIAVSVAVFVACSAAYAAGAPGVPAAAAVAATAVFTAMSATTFAAWRAAAAAAGIPRHAGKKPIKTFILPGPGVKTGGSGWATLSVILAAGPCGICFS